MASRSATGYGSAQYPALRHSAAAASSPSASVRGSSSHAPSSLNTGPASDSRRSGLASACCTSWSPPAASKARSACSAILFGIVAEIQDHFAPANRARDSRMRCISMLPDDTVEACEYRQWSSTSPRNHFAPRVVVRHLGSDVHQHFRAVLVEFGDRDPVRGRVAGLDPSAALQLDDAVRQQSRPAAVRQHAHPPCPQLRGQVVPAVAEHRRRGGQQPLAAGVAGDADPLEGHHVLHDRPALVDGAEHVGLGDPQVVEEHLVEVVRAHHAADRPHLDRRIIHRHQEDRQALLLLLALWRCGRAGSTTAPWWRRTSRSSGR